MAMCFQLFTGCALSSSVPEGKYRQALELVDQGTANIRQGKLKEANLAFSIAEELAPIAAAVDGQGCVALLLGQFEQAEAMFRRAYNMDQTYEHALANLALLQDIRGSDAEAKRLYDRAIKNLPELVTARNNRAALEYDRSGRKIEAVQELEKADLIAKHPIVTENLARLGVPMIRSEIATRAQGGPGNRRKNEFVM
jgi:Flp pilus assembly protein TadD